MDYTIETWIDEMNLLKSEKKSRIKTAYDIERELGDFFKQQLSDLADGIFLISVTSEEYRKRLAGIYMKHSDSPDDEWMLNKANRFAEQVEDTTENVVRNIEGKPEFTQAVMLGIPMKKKDVPQKVKDILSFDRAKRVAMNETNVIHNYKHHIKLAKTQLTHTWDATLDEVTRPHHWVADGLTVPVDEPFVIGGERMMFPGDDSLGATAKNLINCRCIEL